MSAEQHVPEQSPNSPTESGDASRPRRQRAVRQDAVRNKAQLVRAVGELLAADPAEALMPAVAERAGLSLTTAYRYFPTMDHLHREFMLSVIHRLQQETSLLTSTGTARFEEILHQWVRIVSQYGEAMVIVRSREGFLTRYGQGEAHTLAMAQAWGEAIRGMLEERGIAAGQFPWALTLFNALVNSREILDARTAAGFSDRQLVQHFSTLYQASLEGIRKPENS